jgi:hypothetical protein
VAIWTSDERVDPLPDWLIEAVDRVFADLQLPTPIDVRVGYDARWGTLIVSEGAPADQTRPPGGPGGCLLSDDDRGPWLVANLAQWLQAHFFLETRGAWGEARPACPGHRHPAVPGVEDEEAWWFCPSDGHPVAVIGHSRV